MASDRIITPELVIETARSWIDTPYRHQGREKGRAIDCIGLIVGVGADLGLNYVAPANYSDHPSGAMLMREARQQLVEITDRTEPVPGDIMVLWGWTRQEPQHFAIVGEYGSRLTMIHAWSKRGKVVEHGIDDFWSKRLVALFNYAEMETV